MVIFTRVLDIISANINAMLDKAEDPEKLVKLIIREMEDTLVEIKASCASSMAKKKRVQREIETVEGRAKEWYDRAQLALGKGREDLAREALVEKRRYTERRDALDVEAVQFDDLVAQYQQDIQQLEDKLAAARERQRILIERHAHATEKKRAEQHIRRFDSSDAIVRFEKFEQRVDRLEAEADLVNFGRKSASLKDEFAKLEGDEEIERELEALKASMKKENQ
jgi:phage shock protein A